MFSSDSERLDFLRSQVHTPAVSDILDQLGYRGQAMHQRLRPLLPYPETCGFAGRARTFRWEPVDGVDGDDPYGLEIEGMDSLGPGDLIIDSTDDIGSGAPWGELMTTVALQNGAVGCICDGNIRDCCEILKLGFPVFYAGIRPTDSAGRLRVVELDVPVSCGDVLVNSGELILADFDGIVVIPKAVEDEVLRRAAEKIKAQL